MSGALHDARRRPCSVIFAPPVLGPDTIILRVYLNGTVAGTANVQFAYRDYCGCSVAFAPPVYVNAPPLWGGRIIQNTPTIWTVTEVQYGSTMQIRMTTAGRPATSRVLYITVPVAPACLVNAVQNLRWDIDEGGINGATCLSFAWDTDPAFAAGYEYDLVLGDNIVETGTVAQSADQTITLTISSLPLTDAVYVFVVYGKCAVSERSPPALTIGITDDALFLGPAFTVVTTTPNGSNAVVVMEYSDLSYCFIERGAGAFDVLAYYQLSNESHVNHQTSISIEVLTSTKLQLTAGSTASLPLSTASVTCSLIVEISTTVPASSGTCGPCTFPAAGTVLRQTFGYVMPIGSGSTCSTTTVTPTPVVSNIGVTCATLSWTPNPQFARYEVAGIFPVLGSTFTLTDLTAGREYTNFTLRGICPNEFTRGTLVYVPPFTTLSACTPVWPSDPWTPNPPPVYTYEPAGTYTATVTFPVVQCLLPGFPLLNWNPTAPLPQSAIQKVSDTTWRVSGLPANTTVAMIFLGVWAPVNSCTDCCPAQGSEPAPLPFSLVTPAVPSSCLNQSLVVQLGQVSASSAAFTWTSFNRSFFPFGYAYTLYKSGVINAQGTLALTVNSLVLDTLVPSQSYTFVLRGLCSTTGGVYASPNPLAFTTPADIEPSISTDNSIWEQMITGRAESSGWAVNAKFSLPLSDCVCVDPTTLVLTCADESVLIQQNTPNSWSVLGLTSLQTYAFTLTGSVQPACNRFLAAGTTVTKTFNFEPSNETPNYVPAPFTLTVTHYSGPPQIILSAGKYGGPSLADAEGQATFASVSQAMATYANTIVQGFVAYNKQRVFSVGSSSFSLPINALYFGNIIDPTVQGACVPALNDGVYKSFLPYNYADSSNAFGYDFPPILQYFVQIIQYNWAVLNTSLYTPPPPVQLGLNNYGSKHGDEHWWFNAALPGTTGEIVTLVQPTPENPTAPLNPTSVPSNIDGVAADGNGTGTDDLAGWNCMERWFMHAAYLNQQLRRIIDTGYFVAGGNTLGLRDITDSNVQYFQISAITADGEGNGFDNTYYKPPPPPADLNFTIKCLWNKWFNQPLTLPPYPSGVKPTFWNAINPSTAEYLVAPAAQLLPMGSNPVDAPVQIPCAFSMTTPGLIQGMKTGDLGSADFDAVNAIFHEVYDTSDTKPYYTLGAQTAAITGCDGVSKTGANFTTTVQTAALSTYASNPEGYAAHYGTWDNLVPPASTCAKSLTVTAAGALAFTSATPGSYTAFNDASVAIASRMSTSVYTPWADPDGTGQGWILNYAAGDSLGLGWALESSRYDLYNGAWAAAAAAAVVPKAQTDYFRVRQGANGADGALLWNDLSTGLKPYVAGVMNPTSITSRAALPGQVWMLSNQCGPFVNDLGVRYSKRGVPGPVLLDDLLTFACPDTDLPETPAAFHVGAHWPGWAGMAGQYYGPDTEAVANTILVWSLDQFPVGLVSLIGKTNSTEDNFGVFADFNIQVAAWLAMAQNLTTGISNGAATPALTYAGVAGQQPIPPNIGCYELGFMPMSWIGPVPVPPNYYNYHA